MATLVDEIINYEDDACMQFFWSTDAISSTLMNELQFLCCRHHILVEYDNPFKWWT